MIYYNIWFLIRRDDDVSETPPQHASLNTRPINDCYNIIIRIKYIINSFFYFFSLSFSPFLAPRATAFNVLSFPWHVVIIFVCRVRLQPPPFAAQRKRKNRNIFNDFVDTIPTRNSRDHLRIDLHCSWTLTDRLTGGGGEERKRISDCPYRICG